MSQHNGESGTTSISDLPSSENIQLSVEPKNDSVNMNDLFKEIQSSGESGNLPSRDIPMDKNKIAMDKASTPNYIPEHEHYIDEEEFETAETVVDKKKRKDNQNDSLEVLYEEIQFPILLGVIYFIFQLPVFNTYMNKYASFAFRGDGGLNLSGVVLKSIMFAGCYYILTKTFEQLAE